MIWDLSRINTVIIEESNRPQFSYLKDSLLIEYDDFNLELLIRSTIPQCRKTIPYSDEIQLCYPLFQQDMIIYDLFLDLAPMGILSILKNYQSEYWWMIYQLLKNRPESIETFLINPAMMALSSQYYYIPLGKNPLEARVIHSDEEWKHILKEAGFPQEKWILDLFALIPPEAISISLFKNLVRLIHQTEDLGLWKNLKITHADFWKIISSGMDENDIKNIIDDMDPESLAMTGFPIIPQ